MLKLKEEWQVRAKALETSKDIKLLERDIEKIEKSLKSEPNPGLKTAERLELAELKAKRLLTEIGIESAKIESEIAELRKIPNAGAELNSKYLELESMRHFEQNASDSLDKATENRIAESQANVKAVTARLEQVEGKLAKLGSSPELTEAQTKFEQAKANRVTLVDTIEKSGVAATDAQKLALQELKRLESAAIENLKAEKLKVGAVEVYDRQYLSAEKNYLTAQKNRILYANKLEKLEGSGQDLSQERAALNDLKKAEVLEADKYLDESKRVVNEGVVSDAEKQALRVKSNEISNSADKLRGEINASPKADAAIGVAKGIEKLSEEIKAKKEEIASEKDAGKSTKLKEELAELEASKDRLTKFQLKSELEAHLEVNKVYEDRIKAIDQELKDGKLSPEDSKAKLEEKASIERELKNRANEGKLLADRHDICESKVSIAEGKVKLKELNENLAKAPDDAAKAVIKAEIEKLTKSIEELSGKLSKQQFAYNYNVKSFYRAAKDAFNRNVIEASKKDPQMAMAMAGALSEAITAAMKTDFSDDARHNAIPSILTWMNRDFRDMTDFQTKDVGSVGAALMDASSAGGNVVVLVGGFKYGPSVAKWLATTRPAQYLATSSPAQYVANTRLAQGLAFRGQQFGGYVLHPVTMKFAGGLGAAYHAYSSVYHLDPVNASDREAFATVGGAYVGTTLAGAATLYGTTFLGSSMVVGQIAVPIPLVGAGIGAVAGGAIILTAQARRLAAYDESIKDDWEKRAVKESLRRAELGFVSEAQDPNSDKWSLGNSIDLTPAQREVLDYLTKEQIMGQLFKPGAFTKEQLEKMKFQVPDASMPEEKKEEINAANWARLEDMLQREGRWFSGDQVKALKALDPELGGRFDQICRTSKAYYEDTYRRAMKVQYENVGPQLNGQTVSTAGLWVGYKPTDMGGVNVTQNELAAAAAKLSGRITDISTQKAQEDALAEIKLLFPNFESIMKNDEAGNFLITSLGKKTGDSKTGFKYEDTPASILVQGIYDAMRKNPVAEATQQMDALVEGSLETVEA